MLCKCLSKVRSKVPNLDLTPTSPVLAWWSVKGSWNPSYNQSRGYWRTFQSTVSPGTYCCVFWSISLVGVKSAHKYFCLLSLDSPQRGSIMYPQRMENIIILPWYGTNESESLVGSQPAEKGLMRSSGKSRGSQRVVLVGGRISLWSLLFLMCAWVAEIFLRTEVMWITRLPWVQRGFGVSKLTPRVSEGWGVPWVLQVLK